MFDRLHTRRPAPKHRHRCHVPSCGTRAALAAFLYDDKPSYPEPFCELDHDCPYLCEPHARQNEREARGGLVGMMSTLRYPFTKQRGGTGFTLYSRLSTGEWLEVDAFGTPELLRRG